MNNIIISNNEALQTFKNTTTKENLHVLTDFDGTLTKGFVNGEKTPSIIAELRNGHYLDENYAKRAHELFNTYHPYEHNPDISPEEKIEKMHEWWTTHFQLLIDKKLNLKDIEKVSHSGRVELRKKTKELLTFLNNNNIPLIIMSASGVGDIIPLYMKE